MKKIVFLGLFLLTHTLLSQSPNSTELKDLLRDYSFIHKSLAADSLDQVKGTAANGLISLNNWLKAPKKGEEEEVRKILLATQALSASKEDKEIRTQFGNLSEAVVALVKKTPALQPQWQLMYCPMVPKGVFGFWVQPTGESLLNPYYGAKMLTCGVKRPW
jgi:hypothetical protein